MSQKVMFSIHDYDHEGDQMERGFYLHFGNTRVKVADTFEDFKQVVNRINGMVEEITENYNTEDL